MTFRKSMATAVAVLAACAGLTGAHAQEVYLGAGLFGAQLGYAHSVNSSVNLRADYMTLGTRNKTSTESGTTYQSKLDLSRTALLADWFPFEGSTFRLTAGATFNDMAFDLNAGGAGTTVDINGKSYALGANDKLNIQVKMPRTTPYLGIGWGHKPAGKGWGFHADVGAIIGSFKVSETRSGALVNGGALGVTQADMDKELQDVRDSVAKLKVLPQLTLGVAYRF